MAKQLLVGLPVGLPARAHRIFSVRLLPDDEELAPPLDHASGKASFIPRELGPFPVESQQHTSLGLPWTLSGVLQTGIWR